MFDKIGKKQNIICHKYGLLNKLTIEKKGKDK